MHYSQDDEAWLGECNGRKYSLAYEWKAVPDEDLIAYARGIISDTAWLNATVNEAKQKAILEYPTVSRDEILALSLGVIRVYKYKGEMRIIADMEVGKGTRNWRIEYYGKECEGIGFDD